MDAAVGRYLDAVCEHSPPTATYLGRHEHDGELSDPGEGAQERLAQAMEGVLADLDALGEPGNALEQAERRALAGMCSSALIDIGDIRGWQRNPVGHIEEIGWSLYVLMARAHAPAPERAEALRSRLERVPAYLEAARGALAGVPAVLFRLALDLGGATSAFVGGDLVRWGAAEAPSVDLSGPASRARRAIDAHLAWLAARGHDGAALAVGGEFYEAKLRAEHALSLSADDLVDVGTELAEQARADLSRLGATLPGGSWRAAVAAAGTPSPGPARLLAAYRREVARARDFSSRLGLVIEGENELEVVATPRHLRALLPYAAYLAPGPFEQPRRGLFFVSCPEPPSDPGTHAEATVALTTIHEAYPGHHLQRSVAQARAGALGRVAESPSLVEGWAYYCEELAWEQGYLDGTARLFQLKDQLWRAARLVIDPKLHTGVIGVGGAARLLVEWADLDESAARAEARRYATTPTYQVSYAMGRQEIMRLRHRRRQALGGAFELGAFHRELLAHGGLPVALIAQAMGAA